MVATTNCTMHQPPLTTYIGYLIEYFDDLDLVEWARDYLPRDEHFSSDGLLVTIGRINIKRAEKLKEAGERLTAFVQCQWPDFSLKSAEAEMHANRFFRSRLQDYLDDKVAPWAVCRMVQPIEMLFEYPDWLGNMYNECDWVEKDWTPAHCRHLEQGVRDTLTIDPFVIPPSQ